MKATADMQDALAVVRKYDRSAYAAMQAAQWRVTSDLDDLFALVRPNLWEAGDLFRNYRDSVAITVSPAGPDDDLDTGDLDMPMVVVNQANVTDAATDQQVGRNMVLASTLVHEFRHVDQSARVSHVQRESEAFDAEAEFVARLPANVSARMLETLSKDRDAELAEYAWLEAANA